MSSIKMTQNVGLLVQAPDPAASLRSFTKHIYIYEKLKYPTFQ